MKLFLTAVDFDGAFDRVKRSTLLRKLVRFRASVTFVCCLANLYSVSNPDSVEYLGFAWEIDSRLRYFVFLVLPFGLTSVGPLYYGKYTRLLRFLVISWRDRGIKICCFIDDGCQIRDNR